MIRVDFDVPAEVAFDFLVDPRNRSRWQSSLRRVEDVSPADPVVGQTWTDVTGPGMRPAMETTELDRPSRWTERGRWHGITAELTLVITPRPGGCTVAAELGVRARGALRPVGPLATAAARFAVPADLRRAALVLASDQGPNPGR